MITLENENTINLIKLLLSSGNEYACDYLTNIFNDNLSKFNEFVRECQESEYSYAADLSYRIEEFKVSDLNRLGINQLCINYKWSTTRKGFKENYGCTHGLIEIESNIIRLFNFGPNKKANERHKKWLDNILSREYKFKQLNITN